MSGRFTRPLEVHSMNNRMRKMVAFAAIAALPIAGMACSEDESDDNEVEVSETESVTEEETVEEEETVTEEASDTETETDTEEVATDTETETNVETETEG